MRSVVGDHGMSSTRRSDEEAKERFPGHTPEGTEGEAGAEGEEGEADETVGSADAQKILYFESLFFKLDPDGDGAITFDEARRLLTFTVSAW